jgi:hypothetical protein
MKYIYIYMRSLLYFGPELVFKAWYVYISETRLYKMSVSRMLEYSFYLLEYLKENFRTRVSSNYSLK